MGKSCKTLRFTTYQLVAVVDLASSESIVPLSPLVTVVLSVNLNNRKSMTLLPPLTALYDYKNGFHST